MSDLAEAELWSGPVCLLMDAPTIIRNGELPAQRYRDEIIRPFVVTYAAAIGDESILMVDNARSHRVSFPFRRRNPLNGLASIFPRHEPNRTWLGHSREKGFWSLFTPRNNSAFEKLSSTGVGDNTPVPQCLVGVRHCFRSGETIHLIETHFCPRNHIFCLLVWYARTVHFLFTDKYD
ncbi:hypothetical protein AVEN_243667-1 [Araneus ventricosus]|uniref:Tc1-like transposase DDE domain-containing protein n=1 Tax=Araneus ventricosus TaxID=182803 RepID=A0A4Y2A5I0_ARAVE|nr:hypothetical protein AVEN_243667-1 [Araneus ventricosus]